MSEMYDPLSKNFRRKIVKFALKKGILYRITFRQNRTHLLLVVQSQRQHEIVQNSHDTPEHPGITETFEKFAAHFFVDQVILCHGVQSVW